MRQPPRVPKGLASRLQLVERDEDVRQGDLLLTVDHCDTESLEFVDCVDNGMIFTVDHEGYHSGEEVGDFVSGYSKVYRVK